MIFKAYTYGVGEAIVKGGRYDKLLQQFGKQAPAVGFVMVVDSILEALSGQNIKIAVTEPPQKLFYHPENYKEKLARAQELRSRGISAALIPTESGGVSNE